MRTIAHGTGALATRVCIVAPWAQSGHAEDIAIPAATPTRYELTAVAYANNTYFLPTPSKREGRQNQQPFYRGLKKYRKY